MPLEKLLCFFFANSYCACQGYGTEDFVWFRPAPSRPLPGAEGYVEPAELPDHVIIAMLQREVLLTEAKLHALDYELVMAERKLRQLRSQLRQVGFCWLICSPASRRVLRLRLVPKISTPSRFLCLDFIGSDGCTCSRLKAFLRQIS